MRHAPMSHDLLTEEKELKSQPNKWSLIEESIYSQNSIVQWFKLGNSNTAYFFASIKE